MNQFTLPLNRRRFIEGMIGAAAASAITPNKLTASVLPPNPSASATPLGHWLDDDLGLPVFAYTAALPFVPPIEHGKRMDSPNDPPFILGNARLTMFVNASGIYQLICGERDWLRLNQPDIPNYGYNRAILQIHDPATGTSKGFSLAGLTSLAANPGITQRRFGAGYAIFTYSLANGNLACERTLSVKPSSTPYDGVAAFVLDVRIANKGNTPLIVKYDESTMARYMPIKLQSEPQNQWPFEYKHSVSATDSNTVRCDVLAHAQDPLLFESPQHPAKYDGYPPALFFALSGRDGGSVYHDKTPANLNVVGARWEFQLAPGEERQLHAIIGYTFDKEPAAIDNVRAQLTVQNESTGPGKRFRKAWKDKLPAFPNERDRQLRREMIWNAYTLQAMANYNSYYNETQIPQGTHYAYAWGQNSSARDQYQIGLPLCHFDVALAKSNLRYMMKRTTPMGDIRLIEDGYGIADSQFFHTSDQQLWYFQALAEYLNTTRDYGFLLESVEYYPVQAGFKGNSLDMIDACFTYLRDSVGLGSHDLVHMRYSDWNDEGFYFFRDVSYVTFWNLAESYLNSAMAAVILDQLAEELRVAATHPEFTAQRARIERVCESILQFQRKVEAGFLKELDNRTFSARCRVRDEVVGQSEIFLEPQTFALQMSGLNNERKTTIFSEIQKRLMVHEVMGARLGERYTKNQFGDPMFASGLFWWAMNGELVLGAATFDLATAWRLLRKMSFQNHARHFPAEWQGYWTASDALGSSLMTFEGAIPSPFPAFCGHAHAWPLYCYYKLGADRPHDGA